MTIVFSTPLGSRAITGAVIVLYGSARCAAASFAACCAAMAASASRAFSRVSRSLAARRSALSVRSLSSSPIAWRNRLVVIPVSASARCTGTRTCVPTSAAAWTAATERKSRIRREIANRTRNGRTTPFVRRPRVRPSVAT